ncbi:MAG: ROK family protein, partial [Clostridia bacterium]|nr:ROK family protein [Clostridia bacterium]
IPVYINNDADLYAYGEALAGALPEINEKLEKLGSAKRYQTLLGYTFGTGFGFGFVTNGELHTGDNSCIETFCLRHKHMPGVMVEDGVAVRAVNNAASLSSSAAFSAAILASSSALAASSAAILASSSALAFAAARFSAIFFIASARVFLSYLPESLVFSFFFKRFLIAFKHKMIRTIIKRTARIKEESQRSAL